MTRLEPAAISARRRPAAVLFVFAWQLAWALLVATPLHAFARRVWGAHPDGDAALWSPGARELLVWLAPLDAAGAVALRVTAVLFFAGVVLAQIPLGVLLASLVLGGGGGGRRAPALLEARRAAAGTFTPLLTVLVATGGLQLLVLTAGGFAARGIDHALAPSLGDARAVRAAIAAFGAFGVVALALGVLGDLVRAGVVLDACGDAPAPTALGAVHRAARSAVTVGARAFAGASLAWAWRGAIGLALVGAGALASDALGGLGGASLAALFAAHQLVALARVALRASWLARAARAIARAATATPDAGPPDPADAPRPVAPAPPAT